MTDTLIHKLQELFNDFEKKIYSFRMIDVLRESCEKLDDAHTFTLAIFKRAADAFISAKNETDIRLLRFYLPLFKLIFLKTEDMENAMRYFFNIAEFKTGAEKIPALREKYPGFDLELADVVKKLMKAENTEKEFAQYCGQFSFYLMLAPKPGIYTLFVNAVYTDALEILMKVLRQIPAFFELRVKHPYNSQKDELLILALLRQMICTEFKNQERRLKSIQYLAMEMTCTRIAAEHSATNSSEIPPLFSANELVDDLILDLLERSKDGMTHNMLINIIILLLSPTDQADNKKWEFVWKRQENDEPGGAMVDPIAFLNTIYDLYKREKELNVNAKNTIVAYQQLYNRLKLDMFPMSDFQEEIHLMFFKEQAENEVAEQLKRERIEREEKERIERENQQRLEREEKERLERESLERFEREERERIRSEIKQRVEQDAKQMEQEIVEDIRRKIKEGIVHGKMEVIEREVEDQIKHEVKERIEREDMEAIRHKVTEEIERETRERIEREDIERQAIRDATMKKRIESGGGNKIERKKSELTTDGVQDEQGGEAETKEAAFDEGKKQQDEAKKGDADEIHQQEGKENVALQNVHGSATSINEIEQVSSSKTKKAKKSAHKPLTKKGKVKKEKDQTVEENPMSPLPDDKGNNPEEKAQMPEQKKFEEVVCSQNEKTEEVDSQEDTGDGQRVDSAYVVLDVGDANMALRNSPNLQEENIETKSTSSRLNADAPAYVPFSNPQQEPVELQSSFGRFSRSVNPRFNFNSSPNIGSTSGPPRSSGTGRPRRGYQGKNPRFGDGPRDTRARGNQLRPLFNPNHMNVGGSPHNQGCPPWRNRSVDRTAEGVFRPNRTGGAGGFMRREREDH